MTAAALAMVVQGVQLAISAAPGVMDIVEKAKAFFGAMHKAGLITDEQQEQVHSHVDAICESALRGEVPVAWQVEPD